VGRERDDTHQADAFAGFRREAPASARVLRHALDVASMFASPDKGDAGMSLGCVALSPATVTATDGTKAVIIMSRRLPRVTACLRRDAAVGIVRFLRGEARDAVVSVAVAPGRLRITDAASSAAVVAVDQTIRARSSLTAPTGPTVFTLEAATSELDHVLGFLRAVTARWVHPVLVDQTHPLEFAMRSGGACMTAGMPVVRGTWTGAAEHVPEVPFAALESVMDGLTAARATMEFRLIGRGCLVTSVERVVVGNRASAHEEILITRCAISPAATTDPKEVHAHGQD
jgi:hypothetical protein